jgi:hypothetical protein
MCAAEWSLMLESGISFNLQAPIQIEYALLCRCTLASAVIGRLTLGTRVVNYPRLECDIDICSVETHHEVVIFARFHIKPTDVGFVLVIKPKKK